ncbi:hypothetical protein MCEMRE182_00689 [Candidatus Nanopelagicaceae bacterium]
MVTRSVALVSSKQVKVAGISPSIAMVPVNSEVKIPTVSEVKIAAMG